MSSDEFLCLLPQFMPSEVENLGNFLLQNLGQPLEIDGLQLRPSASIGVAVHKIHEDALELIQRSDRAMRVAKRQGGKSVVISGKEPTPEKLDLAQARLELAIESDIHTALQYGGLHLNFQPIVGVNGKIEAFEALMRCTLNSRVIPPSQFIPVAEKTGLIIRLGEWALVQGASYAARLQKEWGHSKVAVNVSRAQLTSSKFLHILNGALLCSNVSPQQIELELTESLFLDMSTTVQSNIRSIRELGIGLAIDDFGTGYSCLASLKDLPATKLKLDRAFVVVLPEDKRAYSVVKAMTKLAQDLGMTVVAEGVETQNQCDALVDAGVDAIQGHLYAPAMPQDALLTWLHQRGH